MEEKFFLHILTKNLKGNLGKFDSMHRINGLEGLLSNHLEPL
jgi:hypothetical protein